MLSDSDSMSLFCHLAFSQNGNYEMPDEDCVEKVPYLSVILTCMLTIYIHRVVGVQPFPCRTLVLITQYSHSHIDSKVLQGTILDSYSDRFLSMWRTEKNVEKDREKIGEGSFIFNAHKDLLECLATSLEFLHDDVRECFLDLGLFPKGQWISASVLVDIWVGLYELDEDDAYFNLRVLSFRNLLDLVGSVRENAGETGGIFDKLFVTQHDILRDLVICKCLEQQNINQRKRPTIDLTEDGIPKRLRDQDHLTFHASLVSVRTVFSSTWSEMQFPEVEVLILSISTCKFTLPKFIEKMSKLKVLIILNEYHGAELSGLSSLGFLSQLKILRLHGIGCPSINDIREPLKNLQKISIDEKGFFDNLQESSGKEVLIEMMPMIGHVDQKHTLFELQEANRKLDLIEESVGSGNVAQTQILFELQEAKRKLDLINRSLGSGNVPQKQTLFELQEAKKKLDLINRSLGSGNVDQNECQCVVPEIPNFSVGVDVRVKELKMQLFRDNVSMIGLCALGGSGKTALASKLCQDEQVKEIFKDNIIFLTVSSSPDFKVIVEGIFRRLLVGNKFLKFQNDEDAEKQLRYLMKQKEGEPILLVLDDVWEEQFLRSLCSEL